MGIENLGNMGIGGALPILINVGKIFLIIFTVALGAGIVFGVGYFFFRPMMYKLNVQIVAERQGGQVHLGTDKARIRKVRRDLFGLFGPVVSTKMELLKRKITLPTPSFDRIYPNDLRNSPGTVVLVKRGGRDYRVSKVKNEEEDLSDPKDELYSDEYTFSDVGLDKKALALIEPLDDNVINFVLSEIKAIDERHKPTDWVARNQVIIAAGLVCLILFGGLYAGFKYYHLIFDNLGGALSHLDKTLEALNQCRV